MASVTIHVRPGLWLSIRQHFNDGEKDELDNAICGQALCPPVILDAEKLSPELKEKLLNLIEEESHGKK